MKLFYWASVSCACVLALSSCSEDFTVGAPYKNVTFLYGLLAKSDTAHYIKITRGYFSEKQNNIQFAKNADSIYYQDLKVDISEISSNGTVLKTIACNKVDLSNEGYAKDSGTFASTPNYAYKFKEPLNPNSRYRLQIVDNATGKKMSAETAIISDDPNLFKTPLMTFGFNGNIVPLNFSKETNPQEIRWVPPPNSEIVDVYMRFNYEEENTNTGSRTYKSIFLPLVRNSMSKPGDTRSEYISRSGFIGLLTEALGPGGSVDVIKRYVDTPAVYYTAGGIRLREFIDATRAQGGITSDEIRPTYRGGLVGDDVYGLFDTRVTRIIGAVPFTDETVDSMIFSPAFRGLNIVGVSSK